MREISQLTDVLLFIGVVCSARLLELMIADPEGEDQLVIHAMELRPKLYPPW